MFREGPNEESIPLVDASPIAEVEGLPRLLCSSIPQVRDFPGLNRMLVPMGKGSCKDRVKFVQGRKPDIIVVFGMLNKI